MSTELNRLLERKEVLDEEIAKYPYFGTALAAMAEERRGVVRRIAAIRAKTQENEG